VRYAFGAVILFERKKMVGGKCRMLSLRPVLQARTYKLFALLSKAGSRGADSLDLVIDAQSDSYDRFRKQSCL
jgi:hypothetical protein